MHELIIIIIIIRFNSDSKVHKSNNVTTSITVLIA